MPANFSNLQIRYTHMNDALPARQQNLVMVLNLSPSNFDINHTTIGSLTPFTSEFSFILKIENSDDSNFNNLQELVELLDRHFGGPDVLGKDPVGKITTLLNEEIFTDDNLDIHFKDINGVIQVHSVPTDPSSALTSVLSRSSSLQTLATLINTGEQELFSLSWFVKLKFHASSPIEGIATTNGGAAYPLSQSVVLFPEINFPASGDLEEEISDPPLNRLEAFNDELRLNYELTYLPEPGNGTPVASPIGKAAEELSDSLANLTNTLAANLTSTFKTQLQPTGNFLTEDIALWALIKKGTEELSFGKYFNYMESIFCGEDNYSAGHITDKARKLNARRSTPFMFVDAYRAVKIATEAFVMVNCMVSKGFTKEDVDNLNKSVRLVNGVPDEIQLTTFFNNYKERVNGGVSLIPYLAVIRRKLSNEGIKVSTFEDAFDHYLGSNANEADTCYGLISDKLTHPCFLELIWSYWHEESMMVQGLNAICRRFQNIRGSGPVDPLANLEIDPLRPLNNLMWGYIQDQQHRLGVRRRAYEYNHHYGISLKGEAARDMRFADPRSKFIEALHTLLNLASRYYKQSDDMTVKPDGFPILNGLRETHLILSEGAHNQYGDLPSTARAEMLMEQWLLSRPEYRDFLSTRIMVAYPEPWMDRVAALNQMLGYTKTSVLHFNYLAIFGEKILLSIRFGDWANPANTADAASNWANFWRQEIQAYIHAYRAVTGVDLSADGVIAGQRVDVLQPSEHLYRRLIEQKNGNGQMPKEVATRAVK